MSFTDSANNPLKKDIAVRLRGS